MPRRHPLERLTPKEAVALQRELAGEVVPAGSLEGVEVVVGVDVSLRDGRAAAGAVAYSFPDLEVLETRIAARPLVFPYVPGLLSFRELPVVLAAVGRLRTDFDVLLVDGQGLAHPRRFGIACHLGVELDRPAVGCAKSRLVGEHREPAARRGSRTRLVDRGERIGTVLRTRDGVRPLYVSTGHRVDLDAATRLVLRCARGYRLPEPTRAADRLSRAALREGTDS